MSLMDIHAQESVPVGFGRPVSNNPWKDHAIRLEKILRLTSWCDCDRLDHSQGDYHTNGQCPVVAKIEAAFAEHEEMLRGEK